MTTLALPVSTTMPPGPPPEGVLYEIVDGRYEELPPMSTHAGVVANLLTFALNTFARPRGLGIAVCEILFGLTSGSRRKHRPDVAYVSHDRWPKDRPWPDTDPWPVVPEIAVEVISPNDLAASTMQKVKEYLEAGVKLVWVVYPEQGWLHVFEAPNRLRGLTAADTLDAPSVLPGFSLPLGELFTRPSPPSENGDGEPPAV